MNKEGYFITEIQPRFCETDALGHIGNTVIPVWFEQSRRPIFRSILDSTTITSWPLIIARIEVDYVRQMYVEEPVSVFARVVKIGTKSFTLEHQAWQNDELCSRGTAVMVYFDFTKNESCPIPIHVRERLEKLLNK